MDQVFMKKKRTFESTVEERVELEGDHFGTNAKEISCTLNST